MSHISKKQKVTHKDEIHGADEKDEDSSELPEQEQSGTDSSDESDRDDASSSSVDTETEVALTHGKSKKTASERSSA